MSEKGTKQNPITKDDLPFVATTAGTYWFSIDLPGGTSKFYIHEGTVIDTIIVIPDDQERLRVSTTRHSI